MNHMFFTIGNINLITLMITMIGFYLAYYQFFKINKDKKSHLLKLLDGQLDCLGVWVGTDSGNGYGDELTEEQKYQNALPSKVIYDTGSAPLINSTILESMNNVPNEIIGEINQLYYDLKRIESIQSYRNQLTSSDLKLTFSVETMIKDYQHAYPKMPFHHFLTTLGKKQNIEKAFIEMLLSYGATLHCKVIGNRNNGASQHWTKIKDWIKDAKEKELRPDYSFILVTFVVSFLVISLAQTLFVVSTSLTNIFLLSIILTLLLSLKSSAINCYYLLRSYGIKWS